MPRKMPESGLPPPIPGEPFSLIGTLRRTSKSLTVQDAAELLQCSVKSIYKHIAAHRIPVIDLGFDLLRIDPKAWAQQLEHDNRHLMPSVKAHLVHAQHSRAA